MKCFFERDDVLRCIPGQKSTVARKKIKEQKRILLDTLEHLHMKYFYENTMFERLSCTTFSRLRPFWILPPTSVERDTCLCKTCENVKLMAECLERDQVLKTSIAW